MKQSKIIVIRDGKRTDITSLIDVVIWKGDITRAYRELSLTSYHKTEKPSLALENGDELQFYYEDSEVFRGTVFYTDGNKESDQLITAYENTVYLTKSSYSRKFKNLTASQLFKRLCKDYGIEYDKIEDTKYVLPKLIFREKTLYQMIRKALTETEKQTGRRFFVLPKNGKFSLVERKNLIAPILIDEGHKVKVASYSKSIDDLKTSVKVVGKNGQIVERKSDSELSKLFGSLQLVEKVSSSNSSAIKQRAREALKQSGTIEDEALISVKGHSEVISGGAVYVKETTAGIFGGYYVNSDLHVFTKDSYEMSLSLSAGEDLPQLIYKS